MKTQKQIIGSVSHGTCNPEHLIPRFLDVLEELDGQAHRKFQAQWSEIIDTLGEMDNAAHDAEQDNECLEELFNKLEEYAPPYFYFGSHPGDGSDYGFWLSEEMIRDFDGLKVDDTGEVPEDYSGEVLHVNDHGNLTLYTANRGQLTEVWAIV